jgi:RsiW-degrading membrane proteinase PrsW (M82 family)
VLIALPVLLVGIPIKALLIDRVPIDPETMKATNPFVMAGLEGFIAAALPEELFKFLVVWLYCSRHKAFDEPMDGLVYGATASLGFAALENLIYTTTTTSMWVVVGRAVTAVPLHACLGAIMGYYVARAKFGRGGFGGMLYGLFVAYVLHGLYDFFLMVPLFASEVWIEENAGTVLLCVLLGLGVLIVSVVWTLSLVSKVRAEQQATA